MIRLQPNLTTAFSILAPSIIWENPLQGPHREHRTPRTRWELIPPHTLHVLMAQDRESRFSPYGSGYDCFFGISKFLIITPYYFFPSCIHHMHKTREPRSHRKERSIVDTSYLGILLGSGTAELVVGYSYMNYTTPYLHELLVQDNEDRYVL